MITPLIIVYYDSNGDPFIKIKDDNIDDILNNKYDMNWFLQNEIIEYISIEEM